MFIPITKVNIAKRLVYGTITEEIPDKSGEIFDYATGKPAVQKWSDEQEKNSQGKSKGNVRAMHGSTAAGKFTEIEYDDTNKRIEACAKIIDDAEWNKVQEGVYTGFSIGGGYAAKWTDPKNSSLKRYTPKLSEVSLVDNPCVPSATFEAIKADGTSELRKFNTSTKEDHTMTTATHNSGGNAAKKIPISSDMAEKLIKGDFVAEAAGKSIDELDLTGLPVGEVNALTATLTKNSGKTAAAPAADAPPAGADASTVAAYEAAQRLRKDARKQGEPVWKSTISGKIFDTKDEMEKDNLVEMSKAASGPAQELLNKINDALTKKEGGEMSDEDKAKKKAENEKEAKTKEEADKVAKEKDDADKAAKSKEDEEKEAKEKSEKAAEAGNLIKSYPALALIVPETQQSDPSVLFEFLSKADAAEKLMKKVYSDKDRKDMADKGEALPDGSFPIKNKKDLENAIQAFGRAKDKDKAKAHIKARAKALGLEAELPEEWTGKKEKSEKLAKNLYTVAELARNLQSIAYLQESTERERTNEKDESKVPEMLMEAAKQIGESLKAMVVEEVDELFEDGDDEMPVYVMACSAKIAPGADALSKFLTKTFTPELIKAVPSAKKVTEDRITKFAEELAKLGAKHSKADMEKYADMHKCMSDHKDAMSKMAKDHFGDMSKMFKDAGMLPGSNERQEADDTANSDKPAEKLFKTLFDAEKQKNEVLEKSMAGLSEQLGTVLKRIDTLEAQPLPGKGVLRSLGKNQDSGNTGAGNVSGLDQLKTEFAKLTPDQRNNELMKLALSAPILAIPGPGEAA